MTESHKALLEKNNTHIYKIVLLTLSPPKGEIDFNFLTTNCNFVRGIIFLTSGLLDFWPRHRGGTSELLLRVASSGTTELRSAVGWFLYSNTKFLGPARSPRNINHPTTVGTART
jgi:hypothetical protein